MARFDDAIEFLTTHDAGDIAHPGGTLLAHLRRTSAQLAAWDAGEPLVLAGLCHAAYGTDGFPPSLISWTERDRLRDVIGPEAEQIVYFYASCDREQFYPRVGRRDPLIFRDRFVGEERAPSTAELRDFFELTFANELDLVEESPSFAAEVGPAIAELFGRCGEFVTAPAAARARELLGPGGRD